LRSVKLILLNEYYDDDDAGLMPTILNTAMRQRRSALSKHNGC